MFGFGEVLCGSVVDALLLVLLVVIISTAISGKFGDSDFEGEWTVNEGGGRYVVESSSVQLESSFRISGEFDCSIFEWMHTHVTQRKDEF